MGSPCRRAPQRSSPRAANRSKNRRMTAVLPIGYVTILEAAEMLQPVMYAGVPDLPIVTKLRQEGIEVNDGPEGRRQRRPPHYGYRRSPSSSRKARCAIHERNSCPAHLPGERIHIVAAVQPRLSRTCHVVWIVASHRNFGIPDDGGAKAGAQIDASTATYGKNRRQKEAARPAVPPWNCSTSDPRHSCSAKMEPHAGDEGTNQRGQSRRKMAAASESRHRDPGTRPAL